MGNSNKHAAPLLGDVGHTTVGGKDERTGATFEPGEDIFGPFEAGFGPPQDFVLEGIGCSPGSLGYMQGGIDTNTTEKMMAYQCNITLPWEENEGPQGWVSLLDECGGHTLEYHFHERMSCLYDGAAKGHSIQIGQANDKSLLYGKFEKTDQLPQLDACGGHFGPTPDSHGKDVYHYHVQDLPPFTFGCYGPNDDGELVTVQQCRSFYPTCDGNVVSLQTSEGPVEYDDWCPCYDARGSNTGRDIRELPALGGSKRKPTKKVAFMAKYAPEPTQGREPPAVHRMAFFAYATLAIAVLAAGALLSLAARSRLARSSAPRVSMQRVAQESSDTSQLTCAPE